MSTTATSCEEQLQRGIDCKAEGMYDEAIELFKLVLAGNPDDSRAHMELGLVYGYIGMFDESIAELELAVSLTPDEIICLLNLAKTYSMLGMNDEARGGFLRILEIDPDHDEARRQLAFFE